MDPSEELLAAGVAVVVGRDRGVERGIDDGSRTAFVDPLAKVVAPQADDRYFGEPITRVSTRG